MHRGICIFLLLAFLISSCTTRAADAAMNNGPIIVTADPKASATATPFQPAIPTALPTLASPTDTPTPTLVPSETASPTPTSAPTFTPMPASARPNYLIYATLDYDNKSVNVDELIAYPNQTGLPLNGIVLVAEPNMWKGCFNLQNITVNGADISTFTIVSHRLQIILPDMLQPDQSVTIGLTFTLDLPAKNQEQIFGYSISQINLVNWFPFVAPYHSGDWLMYQPSVYGEHLVYDASDFDINLKVTNPDSGVAVAASAPGEPNGDWMRYRLQQARTFAISASPYFETMSGNVGGVTVNSYFMPGHETSGGNVLSEIGLALSAYSNAFGPMPYPSLSIVETYYVDGMEYDGLIFLSRNFYDAYDGTHQNNLTTIGVHETAHQWWYGLVGNDQAMEPWLDEALATYSEHIFYEQMYPDLVSWWWNYRVRYYDPSGYIDANIYNGGGFRPYTNAVYLDGAYFLDALRTRIGDDVFFAFLRDYARQMAHRIATKADFFNILNQHTSTDYSDIVKNYFQNP
jgi:peptidase M1-like protein